MRHTHLTCDFGRNHALLEQIGGLHYAVLAARQSRVVGEPGDRSTCSPVALPELGPSLSVTRTTTFPVGPQQPISQASLGTSQAQERLDSALDQGLDAAVLNAIARVTVGNFRLIQRLAAQIDRVLTINSLGTVTSDVVDAACESLVVSALLCLPRQLP